MKQANKFIKEYQKIYRLLGILHFLKGLYIVPLYILADISTRDVHTKIKDTTKQKKIKRWNHRVIHDFQILSHTPGKK